MRSLWLPSASIRLAFTGEIIMADYEMLRRAHKPSTIDLLFLAESPPVPWNGHTPFFYDESEDMPSIGLFQTMMKALYPQEWRKVKKDFLTIFKTRSNYYLIDASSVPLEKKEKDRRLTEIKESGAVFDNIKRLAEEGSFEAGRISLIIIGSKVHEVFYGYLVGAPPIETSRGRYTIAVLNKEPLNFPRDRKSTDNFIRELRKLMGI